MGKLNNPKQIRMEDFGSDQQEIVSKIANTVNDNFTEVFAAFEKDIDYNNLNRDLVDISVKMDATGNVVNAPQVKYSLKSTRVRGVICVRAINLKSPGVYPNTTPFVSWTLNGGILKVLAVTGLQNNSEYKLTLELIG